MRIPTFLFFGLVAAVASSFGCATGPDPGSGNASEAREAADSERETAPSRAPLRALADRVRDPAIARRVESASLALLPVEVWAGEFRVPLRLRIEWPGGQAQYEVLLERRPGRLELRERTKKPAGVPAPGFRLALVTGSAKSGALETLEVEPGALAALPFAPAHLLADVQRAFYPWLLGVPECGPCERSGWRGHVAVWERVGKERIIERRLAVAELLPYGSVRVRYAQRTIFGMPALVALENGWIGYRLVFEALDPAKNEATGSPEDPAVPGAPVKGAAPRPTTDPAAGASPPVDSR